MTSSMDIDPQLLRWAADTWQSLAAMTDPETGLPADNIGADVRDPARSGFTSPTNIGGLMWSTVAAREIGLIDAGECSARLQRTLDSVGRLARHESSGMFYNWYDERSGEVVTQFRESAERESGEPVHPFLSSVDNGWLAVALMVVRHAEPALELMVNKILRGMDFASFYDPEARPGIGAGLLRGGFWETEPTEPTQNTVAANHHGRGPDVHYTAHHYGPLNSEPRIASYIGIALGQIPNEHFFAMSRGPLDHGTGGFTREYLDISVDEGSIGYRGMRIVPTWGGSMFEALMPDLFVPEANWGPYSFGINHPLTVRAQREFGVLDAGYGYWGFSPASRPGGGYSEWGAAPIGMPGNGYPSDLARTALPDVLAGRAVYEDGVITPHALFLALAYEPEAVCETLERVQQELGAYGDGGFYDAVAVRSGIVADRYLALDQSMIMASLANHLCDNVLKKYFCLSEVRMRIRPLLGLEHFAVGTTAGATRN